MFLRRIHLRTNVLAVSLAFAIAGAAVAGCDPATQPRSADVTTTPAAEATEFSTDEASFLEEIRINDAALPGKSAKELVAAGYATCEHLRGGVSVLDETSAVERTYRFDQGPLFVSAATTNLCPDFAS
ncbi:DUF732 domain-containing protein [Nocardia fluminea]|uniref:Uncharacterized protein DUF732 n=1 Tax=Nocardia fluminea TaxID=134984 RepID=A0A2N3VJR3_9NOCA|nr:DUF732 domain-containing protein [Nocardia fluminea]PKV81860.1 uncharacterized protein DUF732 [Nocardia fluminea]